MWKLSAIKDDFGKKKYYIASKEFCPTGVAEGNTEMAQHRLEDMACLNVAAIAALTHLPVTVISADTAKRKV